MISHNIPEFSEETANLNTAAYTIKAQLPEGEWQQYDSTTRPEPFYNQSKYFHKVRSGGNFCIKGRWHCSLTGLVNRFQLRLPL